MAEKITRDVVDSYFACHLKCRLKLAGEHETDIEFRDFHLAEKSRYALRATETVVKSALGNLMPEGPSNAPRILIRGSPFVFDFGLEINDVSIRCDALKRVHGASALGDFHYIPVLFFRRTSAKKHCGPLLAICALLLGAIQNRYPTHGIVVHGEECKIIEVALATSSKSDAEKTLDDIRQLRDARVAPKLRLNSHCPHCEFRKRCQTEAIKSDDLSLLRGMKPKEIDRLNKKGIFTVNQLSFTFRPYRRHKPNHAIQRPHQFALQALALRERKIYLVDAPAIPDAPVQIYFDIEGDADTNRMYLFGLVVCESGNARRYSFWSEDEEHEAEAFSKCVAVINAYSHYQLFHYGSYETRYLHRIKDIASDKAAIQRMISSSVNVLAIIYSHVYFPVYSNSLKDIASYLGFAWSEPAASGLQSILWRSQWELTKDPREKQRLVVYNLEDCDALRRVTEVLYSLCAKEDRPEGQPPGSAAGLRAEHVGMKGRLPSQSRFKINFVLPDMKFVNKCAYFDYQRERVFVRTHHGLRKLYRSRRVHRVCRLRITKRIEVLATMCPQCSSTLLTKQAMHPHRKRAFDLKITSSGMVRQVIECSTAHYLCAGCGHRFLPHAFQHRAIHLHSLKSWAIQQHVANRVSFRNVVRLFDDFFGLTVESKWLHMYKAQFAREYEPTYQSLLDRLLAGPLIHVDETEMDLKTGKCYVWVFTSLTDVVYMYRPNREAGFLKELLKSFKGVLVSDFYAGYESLECAKQKCLIHLIRDLNEALLANAFDDELKAITTVFGQLLRSIIETVDVHGLKRQHLVKHEPEIRAFFTKMDSSRFESEVASALRRRLLKSRDGLFTFTKYDGIPWNNNNAENAIRQFAYYRKTVMRMMTEKGLTDYLVLLSIAQSCRYRGISFLGFLTSRKRDVGEFETGNRRPAQQIIEAYPEGFLPTRKSSRPD